MKLKKLIPVGLLVVTLGACASETHGTKDAPIDTSLQDNQAPFIVNMPDTFHNLALKCAGGDLLISHTREGAPIVAEDNALCAEGSTSKVPKVGE